MKKYGLLVMPLMVVSLLTSCNGSTTKEHFVTFDSKGGSHIDTLRVKDNGTISAPSEPTFMGHIFKGWYTTNPDPYPVGEPYTFTDKITSDLTLYAYWQETGVTYHTFKFVGTNCSIFSDSDFDTQIKEGEEVRFTILPDVGYKSPQKDEDVSITGSNTTYENSIVTISPMADDVTIIATSHHQDYVISYTGINCKASNQKVTAAYELQTTWNGEDNDFVFNLTVDKGYLLPDKISVLFDGNEGSDKSDYIYDKNSGTLALKTKANITIKIVANPGTPVVTTYTVTFDAGDGIYPTGESSFSLSLAEGTELLLIIRHIGQPTLENQTFAYYEYKEIGNAIDYDDVVTRDITLKANYFASDTPKTNDLNGYSWKVIKNIAVTGNPNQWFNIGATKIVHFNEKDHLVRIIDFNHDYSELPDDDSDPNPNKAIGITFEFANVITDSSGNAVTTKWNYKQEDASQNHDYRESTINDFLNGDVLDMLPSSGNPNNPNLREVIKPIDKKVGVSVDVGKSYIATSFDGDTYSYPYLFSLAHDEMANHVSRVVEGEGSKYQYYEEHTSKMDLIKKKVGDSGVDGEYYWLRSPNADSGDFAWYVGVDGLLSGYYRYVNKDATAVAPAFCI